MCIYSSSKQEEKRQHALNKKRKLVTILNISVNKKKSLINYLSFNYRAREATHLTDV